MCQPDIRGHKAPHHQDNVPQHKRNKLKQKMCHSNFATVPAKTLHSLSEVCFRISESSISTAKMRFGARSVKTLNGQAEVCHYISESSPWPNWGLPIYQWKLSNMTNWGLANNISVKPSLVTMVVKTCPWPNWSLPLNKWAKWGMSLMTCPWAKGGMSVTTCPWRGQIEACTLWSLVIRKSSCFIQHLKITQKYLMVHWC